jgi:hypothetical protein
LAFAVVLAVSLVTLIFAMQSVVIHNTATIKTVGIDCDTTSIDWGLIEPGGSANHVVHLRASGTAPVTLTFNASNWNPTAAQPYMTLTWNYSGSQITSSWVPVQFTLSVSPAVQNITNFSFDITITGSG